MKYLWMIPLLALAGCGSSRPNYFPSQIGQQWDMVADGTGDKTHFEIVGAPTTDHTDAINIHITKTQTRAYWQNGMAGAQVWWGMHQEQDGRWIADYSISNFAPPNLMRNDYLHSDNNSYLVLPPTGVAPGQYVGYSKDTWCVGDAYCTSFWVDVVWVARISYAEVDTPAYTGVALLNVEFECGEPVALSDIETSSRCARESWYFAPNIGLVEIAPNWIATPGDPLPPVIRRIN